MFYEPCFLSFFFCTSVSTHSGEVHVRVPTETVVLKVFPVV
ncbi:hypothetical protein LEP1GSC125_1520 [Leptospira mayottensis 200901122]|uniref:Uncharacterized protein n=1 Tax=Leptospira mayottensis 200901122 TaxID=1193010 RepID=A0AA87SV84_9LEPT|nr:hypothetical protein LEP1GSC125_1520 [Leptospira mayottensis 200901122]